MGLAAVAIAGVLGSLLYGKPESQSTTLAIPQPVSVTHAPADAHVQSVALARMITNIPEGTPWAIYRSGWRAVRDHCEQPPLGSSPLLWKGNAKEFTAVAVRPILAEEVKQAGLISADDPDNMFNTDHHSDLLIAGSVKNIEGDLCLAAHETERENIVYDLHSTTGAILLTIEWQVYAPSDRKVLLTTTTQTGADYELQGAGMFDRLVNGAIRENIRALLADPDFQKIALAPPTKPELTSSQAQTPLPLSGSLSAKPTKISDAIGAVVLIESGDGHGSGVLISSDGYVLTDRHVVASDKYVKIRWSDGLEGLGEVIRSDKRRDVALIKTDPRGRMPLPLNAHPPDPGATVFAIGAPEDVKLQSTVTRGVVSATNRIVDGFSYIQSDVTVNPGNSGGPLLDEKGQVLGLTDWKLETGDGATGLNFFTPIGDALAFLSLEPR